MSAGPCWSFDLFLCVLWEKSQIPWGLEIVDKHVLMSKSKGVFVSLLLLSFSYFAQVFLLCLQFACDLVHILIKYSIYLFLHKGSTSYICSHTTLFRPLYMCSQCLSSTMTLVIKVPHVIVDGAFIHVRSSSYGKWSNQWS